MTWQVIANSTCSGKNAAVSLSRSAMPRLLLSLVPARFFLVSALGPALSHRGAKPFR